MKQSDRYHDFLIKRLKNPKEALAYLNACLEGDDHVDFLIALRNVAEAHGGLGKLAKKARLNREHLFRMLSKRGNPRLDNLKRLADAFGWSVALIEKERSHLKRAA